MTDRPRHRAAPIAATLTALLLASAPLALTAPPAAAHASLVSSTPEDGAVLDEPPTEITLTFSEDVGSEASVSVTHRGETVTPGTDVVGPEVALPINAVDAGTYTVAYRVVSADGHPITGELAFEARNPAPGPTPAPSPGADSDAGGAGGAGSSREADEPPTEAETEPASSEANGGSGEGPLGTYGLVALVAVGVAAAVGGLLLASRRRGNRQA